MTLDLDQLIRDADPARGLVIPEADPATARTALRRRPPRRLRLTAGALAPGLAVLIVVAVVAVVIVVGGHRSSLRPTTPASPPKTGLLLLQTPDPAGGLPWGLGLVRARDGQVCIQVAHVRSGRLGAVGRYGAYGNDGRFHPVRATDYGPGIDPCTTPDANGNMFYGVLAPNASASADTHVQPAASADRRTIQYGLYGPDVVSITYVSANGRLVTRTTGPGGSYLVVLPHTRAICRPGVRPCIALNPSAGTGVIAGAITAVTYRDGSVCRLVDRLTSMCPAQGRVFAPRKTAAPTVPRSRVATTVSARVVPAHSYCEPRNVGGQLVPCDHQTPAGDIKTTGVSGPGSPHGELVLVSFIARLASDKRRSYYEMAYTKPCGGGGGGLATQGSVHAAQHITQQLFIAPICPGRYTGSITYQPRSGIPDQRGTPSGREGSTLVGRFSFTIPGG